MGKWNDLFFAFHRPPSLWHSQACCPGLAGLEMWTCSLLVLRNMTAMSSVQCCCLCWRRRFPPYPPVPLQPLCKQGLCPFLTVSSSSSECWWQSAQVQARQPDMRRVLSLCSQRDFFSLCPIGNYYCLKKVFFYFRNVLLPLSESSPNHYVHLCFTSSNNTKWRQYKILIYK